MRIYVERVLCTLHFLGFFIFLPLQLGCIVTGPKSSSNSSSIVSPESAMWWAHMFLAIVTDTNAHVLLRFVFSFLFRYTSPPPLSLSLSSIPRPGLHAVLTLNRFFFRLAFLSFGWPWNQKLCWPSFPSSESFIVGNSSGATGRRREKVIAE